MADPADLFRTLTDQQLEQELATLHRRIDKLDSAVWPGADKQRLALAERLQGVAAELERRRA